MDIKSAKNIKIAIIGGGAAGFFSAINIKENFPNAHVTIFEKSKNVLAKVKLSGGGRCNLTNAVTPIKDFAKAYPRGEKQLRKVFGFFNNQDTISWFQKKGVSLVTQDDNCVFPESQDSQTIIDLFLHEIKRLNIAVIVDKKVISIKPSDSSFVLHFKNETDYFDKVIVTTGGSPQKKSLEWLSNIGYTIIDPVPSLFTFNMPSESIVKLMGIVVENTMVSIQGTKFQATGPLLITHWGMSGPAVLKLSSFAARFLYENNYEVSVLVNWVGEQNFESVLMKVKDLFQKNPNKKLASVRLFDLQKRLWLYLIEKSGLSIDKKCIEVGKKQLNRITTILTNDTYTVSGKTTFKEEFVTCGGIALRDVNFSTMQSKIHKGLYFAGEVLDIDGITGGYNFQAAWSTAYLVAQLKD